MAQRTANSRLLPALQIKRQGCTRLWKYFQSYFWYVPSCLIDNWFLFHCVAKRKSKPHVRIGLPSQWSIISQFLSKRLIAGQCKVLINVPSLVINQILLDEFWQFAANQLRPPATVRRAEWPEYKKMSLYMLSSVKGNVL